MNKTLTFLFCLFPLFLLSQVVNIENNRVGEEKKDLLGKIELSVDYNKSTNTIFTVKNSTHLQYHYRKNTFMLLTDLQLIKVNSEEVLNNGFLHLRHNYNFSNNWLIAEAFTQVQFNKIQGIQRRLLGGGGARFVILNKEQYRMYLGLAVMYESQLCSDNKTRDRTRISSYLTLKCQPSKNLTIRNTCYYQPRIDFLSDFRISNEMSIEILISKKLKFKSQFNYLYDSKPFLGINDFSSLINGFIYQF